MKSEHKSQVHRQRSWQSVYGQQMLEFLLYDSVLYTFHMYDQSALLQSQDLRMSQEKKLCCYNLKLELRLHLGKDLRGLREMI